MKQWSILVMAQDMEASNKVRYTATPALVRIEVVDTNDQSPIFKSSSNVFEMTLPAIKGLITDFND